jgi:hypothetical protein
MKLSGKTSNPNRPAFGKYLETIWTKFIS